MNEVIKQYIEQNIEYIEKHDYDNLYGNLPIACNHWVGQLTDVLLDIGEDPLEYIQYIPSHYLHGSVRTHIQLPEREELFRLTTNAFCGSKLKQIYIPQNFDLMDSAAFNSCADLVSVNMTDAQVGIIPRHAFLDCPQLDRVLLPKTLMRLEQQAFRQCPQLTKLDYDGLVQDFIDNVLLDSKWYAGSNIKHIQCTDRVITLTELITMYED